jgi:diguanylate cyclase (GGDEF)-like protein
MRAAVHGPGCWRGELWYHTKTGHEYPVLLSISAVRDAAGQVSHHVFSAADTTEIKHAEAQILHLAHHDPLTQLPNRASLQERIAQALVMARRDCTAMAVLFIDLDRFKLVNDTHGHHVGDKLLIDVAGRLRRMTRQSDIVARLGGDEFVLVLNGLAQPAATTAAALAEKTRQLLDEPYVVCGHELHTSCSIGICLYPNDGIDSVALLSNADLAMYHAKSDGRNRIAFFHSGMNSAVGERMTLDLGLQHAIDRRELSVQFQAQQRLDDGRVVAAEALARWQHPTLGQVPPSKFIPIAEDNGLISSIGIWVLTQALEQVQHWRRVGSPDFRVAVNVSAVQLVSEGLVDVVDRSLRKLGLPGNALEIEITESAVMRDPERTIAQLHRLRDLGVLLAIDDFGTGNSSLAYLKQLPLSCLKLDRTFVTNIDQDGRDAAICRATVQMAHALGLQVVAEGVENETQLAVLRELDCDVVQGYLVGRPMDPAGLSRLLLAQQGVSSASAPPPPTDG